MWKSGFLYNKIYRDDDTQKLPTWITDLAKCVTYISFFSDTRCDKAKNGMLAMERKRWFKNFLRFFQTDFSDVFCAIQLPGTVLWCLLKLFNTRALHVAIVHIAVVSTVFVLQVQWCSTIGNVIVHRLRFSQLKKYVLLDQQYRIRKNGGLQAQFLEAVETAWLFGVIADDEMIECAIATLALQIVAVGLVLVVFLDDPQWLGRRTRRTAKIVVWLQSCD